MSNLASLSKEGLSATEACHIAGFGRTKLYEALASGDLKARKLGRKLLILRPDLIRYLNTLPDFKAAA